MWSYLWSLSYSKIFCSLENAGESCVLPMLRSVRLFFELVAKVKSKAVVSHCHLINTQVYIVARCLVCMQLTVALIE